MAPRDARVDDSCRRLEPRAAPSAGSVKLVRLVNVEQPTLASTLRRMEHDGLVERTPDPADRRAARILTSRRRDARSRRRSHRGHDG